MNIFRWSDPILLPLAPTIAGTIAEYLRLISERVYVHLSRNCDNLAPELPTDGSWFWQCQQSIKPVTTSQYQYVSTIAHRLAAKSLLTPLEICQICQICQPPILPHEVDATAGLELGCWHNTAGYIYFQLVPESIERWLDCLDRLPPFALADRLAHRHTPNTSGSALAIAIYAHARCCSLLKLAQREKSIALTADWHIDPPNWLLYYRKNHPPAGSIGIFDSPVERTLIQTLMAVIDEIYRDRLPSGSSALVASSDRKSPRGKPNWSNLTIDLAQSWLAFYRDCRILGEIKLQNPHLAIARCGLTALVRRYLQLLLEGYLGIGALEEL
jgi:hypothetical protein